MNSINNIIQRSLCYIEQLHCPKCDKKVNFDVVERVTAHCLKCDAVLTVNYEDLKAYGQLPPRAPIQRFSNRIG